MLRTLSLLAVTLLASFAVGQTPASFTNYGWGCDLPGNASPLIRSWTTPQVGTTHIVRYIGPHTISPVSIDLPVLMTGFYQVQVPVPLISSLQPANCMLWVIPELYMPIPNNPVLIGGTFYKQWLDLYFRNNAAGVPELRMLRFSDGAINVIGI